MRRRRTRRLHLADEEISIGDYVLSAGAGRRRSGRFGGPLLEGVLGNETSVVDESFARTACWTGRSIRAGGISRLDGAEFDRGNHAEIRKWRRNAAIEKISACA